MRNDDSSHRPACGKLSRHDGRTRLPDRAAASSAARTSSRSSPRRTCPTTPIGAVRSRSSRGRPTTRALRAANADVAIVGAPLDDAVSSRPGARFGPRAIRMAPTVWSTDYAWSIQSDVEPYARVEGGRRRRCAGGARPAGTRPARDPREGVPRGERRSDPDRPGRRSLDDVSERGRRRPPSAPAEGRHRALRRARRHRHRAMGQPLRPRHADASPDRRGVGRRGELRPGGAPRLLAGEGDLGLDARARAPVAHHGRDRGPRGRGGDRRRHRRGAGRPRLHLPAAWTSTSWTPAWRPGPARPNPGGCSGASSCGRSARSWVRWTWSGWTSSRSRRRTTRPR